MKPINTIVKILTALAAIAGAVYVVATYGDKIVAWAKKLLKGSCCKDENKCCCCEEEPEIEVEIEAVEEAAEEAPAAEETVQAEESDFEG